MQQPQADKPANSSGNHSSGSGGLLLSHVTRRQVVKAGGLTALGLVFAAPAIQTLRPSPAFANYVPTDPTCTLSANSGAFGHLVSIAVETLLGSVINISSGPLPQVSGSAPPSYNESANLASVTVSNGGLTTLLETELLVVNASSSVPGTNNSSADATVNDLRLTIGTLLSIEASLVKSSADATGNCGAFAATGGTLISSATVVDPLGFVSSISQEPAPDTQLLNLSGIRVVLNEQIGSGDGISGRGPHSKRHPCLLDRRHYTPYRHA